jgi:hypothetical protein
MPQPARKLNQLGLDDNDYARLCSWLSEIAIELSPPGVRVRRFGGETRIGRKGSLVIYDDGHWHSYEADEGGQDPRSLIEFLRPGFGIVEVRQLAVSWLRAHPSNGSGGTFSNDSSRNLDAEHTALCKQVLNDMVPNSGTLAETYLRSRGIAGDWSTGLIGYVTDDDRPGEGAIIGVITDAKGAIVGIQIGYIDAAGHKVEVGGAQRRQFLIDREAAGLRFHLAPAHVDPALPLFITEGLENALSMALAYPAAESIGLPGVGRMRRLPPFAGRDVVVFRDGDPPNSDGSRSLIKGIDALLIGGAKVRVTDTPPEADANSVLQEGGIAAIHALVDAATPAALSPKGNIQQAAALPQIDYEMERRKRAKALGMRTAAFDAQVERERARRRGTDDAPAEEPDIHPEPVDDIAAVLDAAREEVSQYVVVDPLQLDMSVVWALFTHLIHHATIHIEIAPRLLVSAPAANCGKTTFLEAIGSLCCRPYELNTITRATFIRLMDARHPTLLIDELQGVLRRNKGEIAEILNASHRRSSARTPISVPTPSGGWESVEFDSWGTFAATINGRVDQATASRFLRVTMRRAVRGEVRRHLKYGTSEVLTDCRRKFARWAQDQMALPDVEMPSALFTRPGDNWQPLFNLAALAGSHWPAKIQVAALAAMGAADDSPDDIAPMLRDIQAEMGQLARLSTPELLRRMLDKQDPSADWATCDRGRPINAYYLRARLRDVLPHPRKPEHRHWKVGGKDVKGYSAVEFEDAYRRYLAEDNSEASVSEAGTGEETHSGKPGPSSGPSGPSGTGTNNPCDFNAVYRCPMVSLASVTASGTAENPVPDASVPDAVPDTLSASGTAGNPADSLEKTVPVPDGPDVPDRGAGPPLSIPEAPPEPQPKGEENDEIW